MKLTKDNLYEFMSTAQPTQRVYTIRNQDIHAYGFVASHERNKGFYAYDTYDEGKAILISIHSIEYAGFYTEYEEAKQALWTSVLKELKDIDEVYFKGIMNSKEILKVAEYENK